MNKEKQELSNLLSSMFKRKKTFKNPKAYDRARDRKDKRLYEIEEEIINEPDETP